MKSYSTTALSILFTIGLIHLFMFLSYTNNYVSDSASTLNQFVNVQTQITTKTDKDIDDIFHHYILFLRMFQGKKEDFNKNFFDTFRFFWPFNHIQANLLIVLDDESNLDHEYEIELRQKLQNELANEIKNNSFKYWITYEQPNATIYNKLGWNRQQWSMFWCDKFLKKLDIYNEFQYIGFVDTDTMFVSLITPQTIFQSPSNMSNPKPIIIAHLGFANGWFLPVAHGTKEWFGKTELFQSMVQFPFTFKISHIEDFRAATVKYWFKNEYQKHHFDEVAQILIKKYSGIFSQFSIFANYAWYYAQDRYEFYFEPNIGKLGWTKRKTIHEITGADDEILNLSSPAMNTHDGNYESMVRIANHERHTRRKKTDVIAKGYCFSTKWDSKYCNNLDNLLNLKHGIYDELFEFENINIWTKTEFTYQSLKAQNKYYQDVEDILVDHYWHKPQVPSCMSSSHLSFNNAFDIMNWAMSNC